METSHAKAFLFLPFFGFFYSLTWLHTLQRPKMAKTVAPISTPVLGGKTRICVAGWVAGFYSATRGALKIATQIEKSYPAEYETWYFFSSQDSFYEYTQV